MKPLTPELDQGVEALSAGATVKCKMRPLNESPHPGSFGHEVTMVVNWGGQS